MEEKKKKRNRRKSNGEGSISSKIRNGKPYYTGQVTVDWDEEGKQIRKSFSSFKKSEVVAKMNAAREEYKQEKNISNKDMTFGELYKHWIFDFKKQEVSDNTLYEFEATYRLRIAPYKLSRLKACEIELSDLQKYFNDLQKKFSTNTIKKTYTQIQSCIKFAVIQGMLVRNQCPGVALKKVEKKEKNNVFSKEEQDLILNHLDLRNIVDCVIYFTFYTGLRLGEVLGLKWQDIDGNILTVKRQYGRNVKVNKNGERTLSYEFRSLKTKNSMREIPLPKKATELLDSMIRTGELIFGFNDIPIEHKRPQRRISAICKELKIPHRSFHALRHSYATRLFELDIPVKAVQVLLGHSEIATTLDIYTHVMKDKKIEYINKLNLI